LNNPWLVPHLQTDTVSSFGRVSQSDRTTAPPCERKRTARNGCQSLTFWLTNWRDSWLIQVANGTPTRTLSGCVSPRFKGKREKCLPISYLLTNCLLSPPIRFCGADLTIRSITSKTRHMDLTLSRHDSGLEHLVHCQLENGGWPFHSGGAQAAIEPTALALLALPPEFTRERNSAIRFLLEIQNPNGSWPAFQGDDSGGSGFTGLAVYALQRSGVTGTATNRAVWWLLRSRGWESHWLWKWKFRTTDRHVRFDPDKFGWPWMAGTVSWVTPTAYSLLALTRNEVTSQGDLAGRRVRHGVEMLYDRMCLGGGWNAGNGVVYETALAAHPDVTAVALLALSTDPMNGPISASLEWLKDRAETCRAPWSLGWTILALHAYGVPSQRWIDTLCSVAEAPEITDCATLAVVCMALRCLVVPDAFGAKP
jgi:hypothetical protein